MKAPGQPSIRKRKQTTHLMTSKRTDTSTKVAVRRRNESISSESPTNVLETPLTLPVTETSPPPAPSPPPTTASYNGKIKQVVLIETSPQDEDSGISESASEELTLVLEGHKDVTIKDKDGLCRRFLQIFFPFLIAGAGMMLAGMLLDYVQVRLHEFREYITSLLSLL